MSDTRSQKFRLGLVSRIGTRIHGTRWIAPLAADLAAVTGRAIAGPQISNWLAGTRSVPDWIEPAMLQVMQARIVEILNEGKDLQRERGLLEARLAARLLDTSQPVPVEAPEPDEDAPSPGM